MRKLKDFEIKNVMGGDFHPNDIALYKRFKACKKVYDKTPCMQVSEVFGKNGVFLDIEALMNELIKVKASKNVICLTEIGKAYMMIFIDHVNEHMTNIMQFKDGTFFN